MFDLGTARDGGPGAERTALQRRNRVRVGQERLGLRPRPGSEPAGDEAPTEDVTGARGVDDRDAEPRRVNLRPSHDRQAPLPPERRTHQRRVESSGERRQR